MAATDWAQKNFIARKPLLAFFVFSYAFFWLFLVFFVVVLNIFHLKPDTLPAWLLPLVTIFGSWMPTLSAILVIGILEGAVRLAGYSGNLSNSSYRSNGI